jgi:putative N6-adenine-specific DNA methylase
VRRDAIDFARTNARTAGVGHLLTFNRLDVNDARPPAGSPGIVICNPPYGERIGDERELVGLYQTLGEIFGGHWRGWRVFVFTGNERLAREVGLAVKSSTPFFNGKIPCRLWEYDPVS